MHPENRVLPIRFTKNLVNMSECQCKRQLPVIYKPWKDNHCLVHAHNQTDSLERASQLVCWPSQGARSRTVETRVSTQRTVCSRTRLKSTTAPAKKANTS